ncbi:MAG: cysteine hydrolase [candidate division Zixibacteria bacterium]|nr:cysteine hydrolase [candidate division Zixibacteria bacterium]
MNHTVPAETRLDWRPFALLLIDVQRDFYPEETRQAFPDFEKNVTTLLGFCRTVGIDIIHIRSLFAPDKSDWMATYRVKGTIPCIRGTSGAETLACAKAQPHEPVMIKQTFDAFYIPDLFTHLQQTNKRFILTAGLVTSVCVLLTTASAVQRGFLATLVEDCCADTPDAHTATLDRYPFIFKRITLDTLAKGRIEMR